MHIILPPALVFKLKLLFREYLDTFRLCFLAVYIPLPWHFVLSQSIVWKCFKLLYKVSIKIEKNKTKKENQTQNRPTQQNRDFCGALLEYFAFSHPCFSLFQRQSQTGLFETARRSSGSQILSLVLGNGAGVGSGHKTGMNTPFRRGIRSDIVQNSTFFLNFVFKYPVQQFLSGTSIFLLILEFKHQHILWAEPWISHCLLLIPVPPLRTRWTQESRWESGIPCPVLVAQQGQGVKLGVHFPLEMGCWQKLQRKWINPNFSFLLFFCCCVVKEKWKFCCCLFQGAGKKLFWEESLDLGWKKSAFSCFTNLVWICDFQEGAFPWVNY